MPYGNDFKNRFLSVADKHAPIRQRRVKSELYKPWLTNEIKQMSYHRDYLKKQSIKLRSANYDKAYKDTRGMFIYNCILAFTVFTYLSEPKI